MQASYRLLGLFLLTCLVAVAWLPFGTKADVPVYLTVHFLDVGQGDAILIESPSGVQMLIDGGYDTTVLRRLGETMPFFDRTIDVVVATHPDADHIGGLVDVLERYAVANILSTGNANETSVSAAFTRARAAEGAALITAAAGTTVWLGASTSFTVLSPAGDAAAWESNNSSVVGLLRYGEIEFLLTGDAGTGIENYLVEQYGSGLASEVLKLGHHGSKTSSGELFLDTVTPEYAVVSAGADNRYGHPHEEVVARAGSAGARILNTAEQGTITFKSDGVRVWVEE